MSENPIYDQTVTSNTVETVEVTPEEAPQETDEKSFAEVADHADEDNDGDGSVSRL